MIVLWGPSFVQPYTEAYRPRSMGQACHDCRAEVWPVIAPMIEAPYQGEPAAWDDDIELMISRRGFLEDCHFKLDHNLIPDETVRPTGDRGSARARGGDDRENLHRAPAPDASRAAWIAVIHRYPAAVDSSSRLSASARVDAAYGAACSELLCEGC
jgi:hypothetical protein